MRRIDNPLKPDLVAPGNEIAGAAATDPVQNIASLDDLAKTYSALYSPYGGTTQDGDEGLLMLSGTSAAATCSKAGRSSPPTRRSTNRA